jgi:hypothetical protein
MFETEVRAADLTAVLEYVREAVGKPDGRIDPVENTARPRLRRVANPLQCGQMYENHYVFSSATFPWRNEFVRLEGQPGDLTVKALRESLKPWGLTREAQSPVDPELGSAAGQAVPAARRVCSRARPQGRH